MRHEGAPRRLSSQHKHTPTQPHLHHGGRGGHHLGLSVGGAVALAAAALAFSFWRLRRAALELDAAAAELGRRSCSAMVSCFSIALLMAHACMLPCLSHASHHMHQTTHAMPPFNGRIGIPRMPCVGAIATFAPRSARLRAQCAVCCIESSAGCSCMPLATHACRPA